MPKKRIENKEQLYDYETMINTEPFRKKPWAARSFFKKDGMYPYNKTIIREFENYLKKGVE